MTPAAGIPHHRGAGLAGPAPRYALLVALLVALACVPTLIAATVGMAALDPPRAAAPVPFISRPAAPSVIILPGQPAAPPPAAGTADRPPAAADAGCPPQTLDWRPLTPC
ncbi:hypothetical protein GCM10010124_29960 [Pilimelia terevasa]|uniref:Uncharacterized protein n=1 Tax=Pilimelia terevasa TaxID=53372 RepID=A0A8J3BU45_9ACTN|nr:hypothetical protein [Pilimelia terevasa]GGK35271.1 hypothetical protein GCM10010124_29960 [Pilimelia terevasa]